jgi:hypothetical protein
MPIVGCACSRVKFGDVSQDRNSVPQPRTIARPFKLGRLRLQTSDRPSNGRRHDANNAEGSLCEVARGIDVSLRGQHGA